MLDAIALRENDRVEPTQDEDGIRIQKLPQAGHEQRERRPALVVFNRVNSLTMVCPLTHTDRNPPFHLRLDQRTRTDGVVICDQVRMLDLRSRHAAFEEKAPQDITAEAVDMISGFIEIR